MWVVTSCDQQLGCGVVADAVDAHQRRSELDDQWFHLGAEPLLLLSDEQGSSAEFTQRRQRREAHDVAVGSSRPQHSGGAGEADR